MQQFGLNGGLTACLCFEKTHHVKAEMFSHATMYPAWDNVSLYWRVDLHITETCKESHIL